MTDPRCGPVVLGTLSIPADQHEWLARGAKPERNLALEIDSASSSCHAYGSMMISYMDSPDKRAAYRYWFWRYRELLSEQRTPRIARWLYEPVPYARAWLCGGTIGLVVTSLLNWWLT